MGAANFKPSKAARYVKRGNRLGKRPFYHRVAERGDQPYKSEEWVASTSGLKEKVFGVVN